ncbi:MAG: InlB B-repeat-containing protein [Ruminococcus sp.]|nr:InlB B-repeat-containing protein [Ruminococcus sp.]
MKHKKSNIRHILLSVTALFVIALVALGVTYSWIEGGTTYSIQTESNGDVKTGNKPDTQTFEGLTLSPNSSSDTQISLNQFDKNTNSAQKLYFSEVSSIDGQNFFFPTAFDSNGNATSFRKANTNDYGTKFINYNFDVNAEKKCYLAFKETPVLNVIKNGSKVTDTSAFRIMLKKGDESYIFTTASTEQTSEVVTSESGSTQTLTAEPASDYVYKSDHTAKIFNFDEGETDNIEVSVWLDGESATSDLLGAEVTVDMNLKAAEEKYKITFDAVTESNSGTVSISDFTGGKINSGSVKIETEVTVGETVSATASANTHYSFEGWYSDADCTTSVATTSTLSKTVTGNTTYYAKFVEKPKYTITVSPVTYPSGTTGGTVNVNGSGTTYTAYKDSTVTINATAADGYAFDGWYRDSACTVEYSTSASPSVTVGSENATYYAKFVKQYDVTFGIKTDGTVGGSGGKVQIDGGTASTSVTKTVNANTQVTLSATANSGYDYKGIYKADGTLVTSVSDSVIQQINADVTYYAYFEKKPASTTTIYFEERSNITGTYYAYVYNTNSGKEYSGGWAGAEAPYDEETGYYKYEFTTSDTGKFRVIVSGGNSNTQYPSEYGLEGDIGGTYLFKAESPTVLEVYDPSSLVTVSVTPVTNGTVTVNGSSSSVKVAPNSTVTLNATANSGYEFVGWYTNSACTGDAKSTSASESVTIGTSNITYYAKFVKVEDDNTIYFKPSGTWQSEGSPRYAMYVFGSNGDAWASMTALGNGYYSATLPDGDWTGIIFCRMNPGTTTNNWTNKWNQTGDLTLPTNGNNCYKMPSSSGWDGDTSGTWSTYTP